ncbi:hypothetical protein BH24ACT9_BH24ACT9_15300 [soil metagenome]
MGIQLAPHHVSPEWPDGTPQQIHLALYVDDVKAAHDEAISLGARLLKPADDLESAEGFQVYADPAGHPFCFCWGLTLTPGVGRHEIPSERGKVGRAQVLCPGGIADRTLSARSARPHLQPVPGTAVRQPASAAYSRGGGWCMRLRMGVWSGSIQRGGVNQARPPRMVTVQSAFSISW